MEKEDRRVKLKKGQQRELILNAAKKIGSIKHLGIKVKIPYSTLKKYAQEVFLLPVDLFNKIIKLASIKKDDLNITYLNKNWGRKIGGKKGMATLQKKYPKEIIEWRKKAIINSHLNNAKKIKKPILNEKLSEFIGVYLGDGTLTKYFVRISGDYRYDIPYFKYLSKIIYELFDINPSIRKEKNRNTLYLTILSKNVCSFLRKNFNLKYGHKIKNKTVIPNKIIEDEKLSLACMRGLIDTDGSISRRGRKGRQFCIQFTSHNKKLLKQVYEIGKKIEVFTFGDKTGSGTNKQENILKFFKIVGSSNLRHIIRFHQRFYKNKTLYQRDVLKHYEKPFYTNLTLPFKVAL